MNYKTVVRREELHVIVTHCSHWIWVGLKFSEDFTDNRCKPDVTHN